MSTDVRARNGVAYCDDHFQPMRDDVRADNQDLLPPYRAAARSAGGRMKPCKCRRTCGCANGCCRCGHAAHPEGACGKVP